jgi:hypothetical protein
MSYPDILTSPRHVRFISNNGHGRRIEMSALCQKRNLTLRFPGECLVIGSCAGEVRYGSSAAVQRANVVWKESGLKDWEKSNATTAAPA